VSSISCLAHHHVQATIHAAAPRANASAPPVRSSLAALPEGVGPALLGTETLAWPNTTMLLLPLIVLPPLLLPLLLPLPLPLPLLPLPVPQFPLHPAMTRNKN
jgi:hypothetical protein